jgi:nitrogenase molybdenum-iron protein beta chain
MSQIIEQPRYSCALAAQMSVLAIPRALPIVHSGPGCVMKTFSFTAECAGNQGEGYGGGAQVSCTNSQEQEVIFGGEKSLRKLIDGAVKVMDADLFVLMAGCTTGIIGDDVVSVANEYRRNGNPIVGAETSGFKGNNYYGHELIISSIIDQFVGNAEPKIEAGLVNVFSVVPSQDPFWRADLIEIKRLLSLLGLKVNILFGYDSEGVSEWKNIPNAQFNLVLNPWVGLETAELLKKKYGTPYLHYPILPVGGNATGKFLRKVAEFAGIPSEKVEAVIKKEEKIFYSYYLNFADFITEFHTNLPNELYLVADSEYTFGTADFLINELGFVPRGLFVVDNPPEKYNESFSKLADEIDAGLSKLLHIESDGGKIQKMLHDTISDSHSAVIFGSTWEEQIARENNNLHIHLSLPITDDLIISRSFVGYTGGLRLIEEIYATLYHKGKVSRTHQNIN